MRAGADVKTSVMRFTVIGCAADWGNKDCVEKLIEAGADVNASGVSFETLVANAGGAVLTKVVKMLLEAGADVNKINMYENGLIMTTMNGREGCLKLMLEAGANPNEIDSCHDSALMYAVQNKNEQAVAALIKAGADVNHRNKNGETALKYAVSKGAEIYLELLLEAGADVNVRDENGETVMEYAISKEAERCVQLLLKAGADPNSQNRNQESLLSMAKQQRSCIKPLLDAGADVKTIENGIADLVLFGRLSDAEVLIKAGVDVNGSGESVLLRGAMNENIKFVKLLLGASAHVNITNYEGHNALEEYIAQNGRGKFNSRDEVWPTSAKKRMCMMLLAAGEDCKETTIRYFDREGYPCDMIKTPVYLLESEFSLKNKCREAIRNHLLELDQHTNLFMRIPHRELQAGAKLM